MATDSKRRLPFHRRAFLLLISLSWALVACFILFQYVRERRYKVSSIDAVLQLENVHLLDMVEGRQGLDLAPLIEVDLPDTLRVTVIGFGGEVLYDSYNEASQANAVSENHRHRPEVEAALSSGSGYTIKRLSESTSERYFYSARRGRYAVMRTAVPYTYSLYSSLRADMGFLWFILAVAAIISIIGYFATRRLGRQIERLRDFAQRAERGERIECGTTAARDEIAAQTEQLENLEVLFNGAIADIGDEFVAVTDQIEAAITAAQNAINANTSEELDAAVETLTAAITAAQNAINAKIEAMQGKIDSLITDVDSLSGALEDVNADLKADIAAAVAKVEEVKTALGSLATAEKAEALAADIAADCAVLLKNEGALPLSPKGRYFVVGELFERMRYQGAGSSMIRPTKLVSPKAAFDARGVRYVYARGYRADGEADEGLLAEAERAENETKGKLALVFAGLTDLSESEGADREDMRLPRCQQAFIDRLVAAGRQIVLVLFGGSPVELPFADQCAAILHMYLPGQLGGEAVARLLFGEVSPSGKLAETWYERYEDVPYASEFSRGEAELYKESVFVGYRYFSTFGRRVRYPFGFGLSYTSFVYRDLRLFREGGFVEAAFFLRNAGECDGAEIVQLYTGKEKSDIFRPKRELRAYKKVRLAAGEEREVRLRFAERELASYDAARGEWVVEGGDYTVGIAASSEDVRLSGSISVAGGTLTKPSEEALAAYRKDAAHVSDEVFVSLLSAPLPAPRPARPITMDTRFCDYKVTLLGRALCGLVNAVLRGRLKRAQKMPEGAERENAIKGALFLKRLFDTGCMRNCTLSAGKLLPYHVAEAAVHFVNGRILRAIARLCRPYRAPRLPKDVQKRESPRNDFINSLKKTAPRR